MLKTTLVIGSLLLSSLIFSLIPAQAAHVPKPKAISIVGNGPAGGNTNLTCTHTNDALCPSGHSCWCNTATGSAKANFGGLGGATFNADTVLDLSSTVGNCSNTVGIVTITSRNGRNSLVLRYGGLTCSVAGGSQLGLQATYMVDSGASTGKFAGATGAGTVNGSEKPSTGDILGNVVGNLLP